MKGNEDNKRNKERKKRKMKWERGDKWPMLRRNAESIICILILRTVGPTVGLPTPFFTSQPWGKAHGRGSLRPKHQPSLLQKKLRKWQATMAKAHPASSEPRAQATLNGSSISFPWGFWLKDQNSKLKSGWHFRLSGLSSHSEVQDFYHILDFKVALDKSP